jgi:molybdenum cofactor cytidylyltransferase
VIRHDELMNSHSERQEKICAVVLAAGAGSRFRAPLAGSVATDEATTHKLLAELRGQPVYVWSLAAVLAAGFDDVVVVTGAGDLVLPESVTRIHNPAWAAGQATSLQCGIQAATELGADAIVVGLGDQPFITAEAWRAVSLCPTDIAVATYAGVRANPVLLRRAIWSLLPSEGDQGARSLIALRPELVGEVACNGSPADIDTMEDLQRWNSSTNSL